MRCKHPIKGYRSRAGRDSSGRWPIVFSRANGYSDLVVLVPCGQCLGCKLEASRQWAMRCQHESKLHKHNRFVTLTYDDNHIPENGSLNKRHLTLFLKRLRKKHGPNIRYYACGEYGDETGRPHYHIILFNTRFSDERMLARKGDGTTIRTSESLSGKEKSLWKYGNAVIGDVSFESAAYVARYCTKKVTGQKALVHYNGREPEYATMSRRPGIGKGWLDKYESDVYNFDKIVLPGRKECKPPRYYDKKYEEKEPERFEKIKSKRKGGIKEEESKAWRLEAKAKVELARNKLFSIKKGV